MKKLLIATLFIPFGLYAQEGFQQEIINQEALTPAFRYENLDRIAITSGVFTADFVIQEEYEVSSTQC